MSLSTEGILDWSHWGLSSATGFNHKSGITQQISNYSLIGSGGVLPVQQQSELFQLDGRNTNRLRLRSCIGAVEFWCEQRVPSNSAGRHNCQDAEAVRRVVGGGRAARGEPERRSAPVFTDTSLTNSSGTTNRVYTLNYRAASAGQTLTVKWTVNATFNTYGNVTLQAATLF